ncbi:universal stress protein [Myxococcus stipitatus]|uniref:universal stress protein n=1 Tax=Myxococcus stipitatus TaxID=83455 RepID=UPI001F3EB9AA|nr:universal stress protein [Myxococcus stipitatus]MCE9670990.1 universal stress protein [Myxococcus stipitatus]
MRHQELTRTQRPLLSPGPARGPRGLARVMVATDFSLRAELALARALRLPLGQGACFTVLHAGAPVDDEAEDGAVAGERCLRKAVTAVCRRLRQRPDVTVSEDLCRGDVENVVVAAAREQDVELVVLGRPPARGLPEDSHVLRLVRGLGSSVLVVVPQPVRPYARPLVAVDFSRESRRALELMLRICPGTPVDVLHVVDTREEEALRRTGAPVERWLLARQEREEAARVALGRFLAPYRETGRELEVRLRGGEPAEGILAEMSERGSDLVVLAQAGRPGLSEGVARVLARAPCDVLVSRHLPLVTA